MRYDTIPIRIQPEPEAFASEQDFRRELDEMIEPTRRMVPDLAVVMTLKVSRVR
ncbi:hypothetical protein BH23PLA1_BH23PLA1_30640 [soil metagenome]